MIETLIRRRGIPSAAGMAKRKEAYEPADGDLSKISDAIAILASIKRCPRAQCCRKAVKQIEAAQDLLHMIHEYYWFQVHPRRMPQEALP